MLAELDYLIGSRVGHQAEMALIDEVARGACQLEVAISAIRCAALHKAFWGASKRIAGARTRACYHILT